MKNASTLRRLPHAATLAALALVPLVALVAPPALAQTHLASEASVEKLLALQKSERIVEPMWQQVDQMMQQGFAAQVRQAEAAGKPIPPEVQRAMELSRPRVGALMREEMAWERIRPDIVRLHRESFTQQEIDAMIAFYASPVGQSVVDKMPQVAQRSMQMMAPRMQALFPKLDQIMRESEQQAQQELQSQPKKP